MNAGLTDDRPITVEVKTRRLNDLGVWKSNTAGRVESAPMEEQPPPRQHPTSEPGDVKRKLFFGAALLLAMASMYAGLLGAGRVVQYGLALVALVVVAVAMGSGAAARR
jgi:hypothetical protein